MTQKDMVTIVHEERETGGRYIARIAGETQTGHLDWEPGAKPDTRVATHTIVPSEIGGRGIAALLVKRLIEDARETGFRIAPQCWYVAKKFDENPDWTNLKA